MKRYFELVDGKSSKFWEITLQGGDVTTRYGKIGSAGQAKTKSFGEHVSASEFADKIIGEKTRKGYTEKV